MRKPWAFICASEDTNSRKLHHYCRKVYELGYVPVCPRLQDGSYLALDDPDEQNDYTDIVRDKIQRCPMLVLCGKDSDAVTAAQIGLAQKYGRIVTTYDGLKNAVETGNDLLC